MHPRLLALASALLCFAAVGTASAATKSAHADLVDSKGATVGHAKITAAAGGVKIAVTVMNLTPGDHGIHIHTVGKCDGPAFTTAGGHFNPTNAHHGVRNTADPHPHLGDLPNIAIDAKGKGKLAFTVEGATLDPGPNSLFHDGGTALVIHAKSDDLMSDPSGNSGDRIACGVIQQ